MSGQNLFRQRKNLFGRLKMVKVGTKDERLQKLLATKDIHWQFNLSRAPWWGGQFKRLIELVKTFITENYRRRMFAMERDAGGTAGCGNRTK